jgi:mannosyltransferase
MSTATADPPAPRALDGATERSRRADFVLIAVPCALAAALVLYQLSVRSLWLDEAATVAIASQHGHALWHAIAHDGGNLLGYYLLLHVLIGAFGHGEVLIRLPSAIATVATVGLTTALARQLFDRRVALAAGLLSAVSLPLVFWGQDARGYAVMIALITASFLAFLVMLDVPGSRWVWVAYTAATVLSIYVSFVAVLVVPAQLLALALRRDRERVRAVVSSLALAALCCVPIAVLAIRRGSGQLFWVPPAHRKQVLDMARWLTSAGMPPNFHRTATGTPLLVLSLLLVAGALVAAVRERRHSWGAMLVALWALIPVVLCLLESAVGQPVDLARNSLVSLPAVSALLAWALTHPRVPARTGYAAVGVLIVLRALQLTPSYGASPENWKAATAYVLADVAQQGDCIAFYPSDGWMAFDYYVGSSPTPDPVLPATPFGRLKPYVEDYNARLVVPASCRRLWFIASHQGQPAGPSTSRAYYARYLALRASLERTYPIHVTKSFGWASVVRVELLERSP